MTDDRATEFRRRADEHRKAAIILRVISETADEPLVAQYVRQAAWDAERVVSIYDTLAAQEDRR